MSAFSTTARRTEPSGGAAFGAFVLWILVAIPEYLWVGFVGMTLWNWFIPGIFDGAPRITLGESIGITLVVSFFTFRGVSSNKNESPFKMIFNSVLMYLFYGLIILAIGAIVHATM